MRQFLFAAWTAAALGAATPAAAAPTPGSGAPSPGSGAPARGEAAERPYSPEQLVLSREITSLALSPDGCRVAFTVDITGAQEVWAQELCGPVAPTRGPAGEGGRRPLKREPGWPLQLSGLGEQATELALSPDGRAVLFASDHGGDEKRDLFLVPAQGGLVDPLTRTPEAETDPDAERGASFSPDGSRVAYVRDGEQPFIFQLFVMDLKTRAVRQLTREPVSLRRPVWSPDARTIAVTRSPDGQRGDLLFVDLASGATRQAAAPPVGGPDPGLGAVAPRGGTAAPGILVTQQFMPDGSAVLCTARNARGFLQLALVDVKSGEPRFIGEGDWDVERAVARGEWIVFERNENARSALYRMRTPASAPERIFGPAGHVADFDVDRAGGRLAYLWGDSTKPADIWVMDLATKQNVRASRATAGGLEPERLEPGRMLAYAAPDGTRINALYVPPSRPAPKSAPPIVVVVHGGPDWQTFDEFDPLIQGLSQAGFAVLAPNYRGSSGYGRAFLDLNHKDWGGKDLGDLWAGVEHLAASGLADPARAGVTGGSYGGYLTLMALAQSSSPWKAGVENYGMPDLKLDYELSGTRFTEWYKTEMGEPSADAALFAERSAINHLDNIRAPLLIFQGANDTNVPPAESELIYRKLHERKVPVGLVVYPDEGHGFTKRANRTDHARRTVDFFRKSLAPGSEASR
ncbi:MAG: S9 family peptidase [Elusimicrobia bacterium]|nr:S9 family peptidase [Elusimicrobiota bacterium]